MQRLAEHYTEMELPGLLESSPNHIGFIGWATYPLFPMWNGNTLGLVFTDRSGFASTHFFRVCQGRPEFVGTWERGDDRPRWLKKANEAWERQAELADS